MQPGKLLQAAALIATACAAATAAAQDENETRKCVDLMRIDHTEVVDESTILFYMKGGDVYRNSLPNRCPSLATQERFMYRVALSQLCSIDVITVLADVGFGFIPTGSCGLGDFQPIDAEIAEQLTSDAGN